MPDSSMPNTNLELISSIYTNTDDSVHEFYIWVDENRILIQENGTFIHHTNSNSTIRQVIYDLKGVVPLTVVGSYNEAGVIIRDLLELDRILDMPCRDAPVNYIRYEVL